MRYLYKLGIVILKKLIHRTYQSLKKSNHPNPKKSAINPKKVAINPKKEAINPKKAAINPKKAAIYL